MESLSQPNPKSSQELYELAVQLGDKFFRTGLLHDLEKSISASRDALQATARDHPDRVSRLYLLDDRLGDRFSELRELSDLKEATQLKREIVDAIPNGHPDRAMYLRYCATGLWQTFNETGVLTDLDEAINMAREACRITKSNDPDLDARLNALGMFVKERYDVNQAIDDLEESIVIFREIIKITSRNGSETALDINNLGVQLEERYSRLGEVGDLEEAIPLLQQAVNATPEGDPLDRGAYLVSLGDAYVSRYERSGIRDDFDSAVSFVMEALRITTDRDENLPSMLHTLGLYFMKDFRNRGAGEDLERAITLFQAAVGKVRESHRYQPEYMYSLGNALANLYWKTKANTDLERAVHPLQLVLEKQNALPSTRLFAAIPLLHLMAINRNWQQAYEVSVVAIPLIQCLSGRSLRNADKQYVLSRVSGLACDAAAVALEAQGVAHDALAFLEQGRNVLATSLEELRADVSELQGKYPDLAQQFITLREGLDRPMPELSVINEEIQLQWEGSGSYRYGIGQQFDEVIAKIRRHPGFENFLLPLSAEETQTVAAEGPVVVLNISEHRCDAIILTKDNVQLVALPDLNIKDITENAARGRINSLRALAWLWDTLANPILDALGFKQPPSDQNWPRIWWIPTGPLTRFPLHAAGHHYRGSTDTVMDRAISSYSSSLKSILHGRRRVYETKSSAPLKALLVPMQNTPGCSKLRFASREVTMLKELCEGLGFRPVIPEPFKKAVLKNLPECQIFHFAGHGITNSIDPSKSQLLLEDWKSDSLTAASLLEIDNRRHSVFLAYLSACGTGQIIRDEFVDENIHLISSFQISGFRHVIGSLWGVDDESCVDMARLTYQEIGSGGLTDAAVARGLHNATRELRRRWLNLLEGAETGRSQTSKQVPILSPETAKLTTHCSSELDRDVVLDGSDDEDQEVISPIHWLPYVHFGP